MLNSFIDTVPDLLWDFFDSLVKWKHKSKGFWWEPLGCMLKGDRYTHAHTRTHTVRAVPTPTQSGLAWVSHVFLVKLCFWLAFQNRFYFMLFYDEKINTAYVETFSALANLNRFKVQKKRVTYFSFCLQVWWKLKADFISRYNDFRMGTKALTMQKTPWELLHFLKQWLVWNSAFCTSNV